MAVREFFRSPLRLLVLFLLAVSVLTPAAHSQGIAISEAHAPINILNISDVDFVNSGTSQWLFSIDAVSYGRNIVAYLTIDLNVTLADGSYHGLAFHLLTKTFQVQAARSFSNLDIGKGKIIADSSYVMDPVAKKVFEDVALPSGQVPAGTYSFSITLHEIYPGSSSASTSFSFILTNPSAVELLFPTDQEQHVGSYPLFQWLFDGALSDLYVYERLPNQMSLEEATQGIPMVHTEIPTTSYLYPAAGVRPLQPGHTYVWYVEGHVRSLGGRDKVLRSALRAFTVDAGMTGVSSLLDELEQTLDPKYKPLFDQIRAEGDAATGIVRVNGSIISAAELEKLLLYLRKNPGAVDSAVLQ
jgi:hypothetical protein